MRSLLRMIRRFCTKSLRGKVARFILSVVVAVNILGSLWIMISESSVPEFFHPDIQTSARLRSQRRCFIPTLNPFEPEIKDLLIPPDRIDCPRTANPNFGRIAFIGKKDDAGRNLLIQRLKVKAPCCYRPFYRVSDGEVWLEPTKNFTYVCHEIKQQETVIPPEHEFIEIICGYAGSAYKDGISFVSRKPKVEKRIKMKEERQKSKRESRSRRSRYRRPRKSRGSPHKLSILIIGLDSTSQMNFIRMMPRSYEYLVNTLSGVQLKGYNKVGENTLPNVIPLLTGYDLSKFKSICVDHQPQGVNSAIHLDGCPFIWKKFSSKGYRTSFAEDEVNTGVFNLHWTHAFENEPTDHYFRTFSFKMVNSHGSFGGVCHGTRISFEILMQNIKDTFATYQSDPLFQFTWASKLSHDDFNRLAWGDRHLLTTLKYLNSNGHLNYTALILVGDHGSRNEEIRKTHQGQKEDRLPLAYIALPPWFPKKYQRAWKNLQENSNTLTTAFDIHETLKDFLDLSQLADPGTHYERFANKKYKSRYGSSLFIKIPESRGCIAAGVPQHWCLCYIKKPILTDSFLVKSAARFAVASFNKILKPYDRVCEPLRLFRVTRALQWKPDDETEESKIVEEEEYKSSSMIQVSFTTLPGHASFEITLINHPDYGFKLTDEIVRLSRYEGMGDCIQQELKILCYCKQNEKETKTLGYAKRNLGPSSSNKVKG